MNSIADFVLERIKYLYRFYLFINSFLNQHYRNNDITEMDLNVTFSVNYEYMNELVTLDLKENGRCLEVDESNKNEFVEYVVHFKFSFILKSYFDLFFCYLKALSRMETKTMYKTSNGRYFKRFLSNCSV